MPTPAPTPVVNQQPNVINFDNQQPINSTLTNQIPTPAPTPMPAQGVVSPIPEVMPGTNNGGNVPTAL